MAGLFGLAGLGIEQGQLQRLAGWWWGLGLVDLVAQFIAQLLQRCLPPQQGTPSRGDGGFGQHLELQLA